MKQVATPFCSRKPDLQLQEFIGSKVQMQNGSQPVYSSESNFMTAWNKKGSLVSRCKLVARMAMLRMSLEPRGNPVCDIVMAGSQPVISTL